MRIEEMARRIEDYAMVGDCVILSDGDGVFQPRKVERAGLGAVTAKNRATSEFVMMTGAAAKSARHGVILPKRRASSTIAPKRALTLVCEQHGPGILKTRRTGRDGSFCPHRIDRSVGTEGRDAGYSGLGDSVGHHRSTGFNLDPDIQ
jgi:hypothetical protein